jgi:hypothetical protein
MTSDALLVAGKALIWFAVPLALAIWEVVRLRQGRARRRDAGNGT